VTDGSPIASAIASPEGAARGVFPPQFALAVALLFILIAPWEFSGFWPTTFEYWPQAIFLLFSAAVTLLLMAGGARFGGFDLVQGLVLAFLGWFSLSGVTTVYWHDTKLECARVGGALIWVFIIRAIATRQNAVAIAGSVAVSVMVVCAQSLWTYRTDHNPRQFGTFYNPNLYANAIAMALPYAVVFALMAWTRTRSVAATAAATLPFWLLAPGLVVTSSKGGFLAAGGGLALCLVCVVLAKPAQVLALVKRRWAVILAIVVIVGVPGGALASKTILPRLRNIRGSDNNSTMFRKYTWEGTLHMAQARPVLGWGPGSYAVAYSPFEIAGYTRSAHESWLQIAAESGFPAMILLAAAFGAALVSGFRQLKGPNWAIASGALGALGAFAIHGCTDSGWGISSIVLLIAISLGLLAGDGPAEAPPPARPGLHLGWFAVTLILAGGGMISEHASKAEDLREASEYDGAQGNLAAAVEEARQGLQSDGTSARDWVNYGNLMMRGGTSSIEPYLHAIQLAPTRASSWLDLANAYSQPAIGGSNAQIEDAYEHAIRLDPNATEVRLQHAKWLLDQGDDRGYADLEYVVSLINKPFGLYPATPDIVNLDYARATVLLAPELIRTGQSARAQALIARGLADVATARANLATQREEAAAAGDVGNVPTNDDLDTVEAGLRALQSAPVAEAVKPAHS